MPLGSALRQSLRDFYFNSWRLAPANLVWGVLLVVAVLAGPMSVVSVLLFALLALPTAGLYRMGALIARDEPASFGDFLGAMRRFGPASVLVALGAATLAMVLTTNIFVGLEANHPLGWFMTAMALWGDVGVVMFLVAFWPVFVDPRRDALGLRQKLALTGLVVIGRPVRVIALTILVSFILAVSTVLFAALVIVSVAYVALVSSRVVLPMVDQIEARLPETGRAP
jgi:hypothetical protein